MGESKHTQGKRRVETRIDDGSAVRKASFVAEVYNDDGILIAQMTCLAHDPEAVDATRADAALDAAAPLMLEALRDELNWLEGLTTAEITVSAAVAVGLNARRMALRAAIKAATGGEP